MLGGYKIPPTPVANKSNEGFFINLYSFKKLLYFKVFFFYYILLN